MVSGYKPMIVNFLLLATHQHISANQCGAKSDAVGCGGYKKSTGELISKDACEATTGCCFLEKDLEKSTGECYIQSDVPEIMKLSLISEVLEKMNFGNFKKLDESIKLKPTVVENSEEDKKTRAGTKRFMMMFNQPMQQNQLMQPNQQMANSWFGNSYGGISGDQGQALMTQMTGMLSQAPTCAVDQPLCQRQACLAHSPDSGDVESDAYACYNIPGCCFDLNVHLYKQIFGIFQNVPTCYQAIKSPLFYKIGKVYMPQPWQPEYAEIISSKMKEFDQQDPAAMAMQNSCPHVEPMFTAQEILQRYPQLQFYGLSSGMQLMATTKNIIRQLSSTCGWNGIDRFQCQLRGCCWLPKNETNIGDVEGRCANSFSVADWENDEKFQQAIQVAMNLATTAEKEEETELVSDQGTSESTDGSMPPGFGASSGTGSSFRSTTGSLPFGLGKRRRRRQAGKNRFNMFGQPGFSPFGNRDQQPSLLSSFGLSQNMPGFGQQQNNPFGNMLGQSAGNTMNFGQGMMGLQNQGMMGQGMMGQGMMGNPLQNPFGQQGSFSQMLPGVNQNSFNLNSLNMQDPTTMLAMQGAFNGPNMLSGNTDSISSMLAQQAKQQKMNYLMQYIEKTNPAVCPAVQPDRRQSCAGHSGKLLNDVNICHARGCCFDEVAWTKTNETNIDAGSFAPARSGNSRSIINLTPQDQMFQGMLPGMATEMCNWNNPYDGLWGLKSLKNVIEPCCQQVHCYRAEDDASWAGWSEWSECSATCNAGTSPVRQRFRDCIREDRSVDVSRCKGDSVEQQACNLYPCPYMKMWSQWSRCSVSCGSGVQQRSRSCSVPGACSETSSNFETRDCNRSGCMSSWTEWSICTKSCGSGQQQRSRFCETTNCRGNPDEARTCNTDFCEGWGEWYPTGECKNRQGCGYGQQQMQRDCNGGSPGSPGCQGPQVKRKSCQLRACNNNANRWNFGNVGFFGKK